MYFGSSWYPEHWPKSRWATDLKLMRDAGFNVVRVAEFAWSVLEPSAGNYQFDWLAEAIDLAAQYGMETVIGTPTAAPPSWLTALHPDILPVRENGRIQPHGARGHYSPWNPTYRQYCARMAAALGRRFGQHPAVIGWQTDNEFWSCARGPAELADFQAFLKRGYGTLEALNEAWGTRYWSQEYFAWEHIQFPFDTPNPALSMAFANWSSQVTRDFQKAQIDALKPLLRPGQFITHNFHPHDLIDRWVITQDLDFPSWDAYPHPPTLEFTPERVGLDTDRIRGLGPGRIWIMETQPGFVNWLSVNQANPRGQIRAMAWSMIGHGAEAVLYWQWRSIPSNQEQYHGAILQQDGTPRPLYAELAQLGAELTTTQPYLTGARKRTEVLLIDRWMDRQNLRRQPHHKNYEPVEHTLESYNALRHLGYDVDVADRWSDLSGYRLIVAPRLNHLTTAMADSLTAWVQAGGHLLLGARSGMKNDVGAMWELRQPGPLAALLGAGVWEYYALPEPLQLQGPLGTGQAHTYAEWLQPQAPDVEVVLRYGAGHSWLAQQPALVTRRVGQGRISYLGACVDAQLSKSIMLWATELAGVKPLLTEVPAGVEVSQLIGPKGPVLVVINHGTTPVTVALPQEYRDLLGKTPAAKVITLTNQQVALLVTTT